MAKFRKGDVVTVEGVVESAYDGMKLKIVLPDYQSLYVDRDQVTMRQENIEVGDEVQQYDKNDFLMEGCTGKVIAVHCEELWVLSKNGRASTMWVRRVARIDPDATPEGAATDPVQPPSAPAGEA